MDRLIRCWINQPSTSQPHHNLSGTRVLYDKKEERIYFLSGEVISQQINRMALSEGWPTHSPFFRS